MNVIAYLNDRPAPDEVVRFARLAHGAFVNTVTREAVEKVYGSTEDHIEFWHDVILVAYEGKEVQDDDPELIRVLLEKLAEDTAPQ